MIQKIKNYLLMAASLLMLATPAVVPVVVSAASNGCSSNIAGQVAQGAKDASGDNTISCTGSSTVGTSAIARLAKNVVNIFSLIVGAVAVIMIIYGGFRYITSGGESGRVGNAKNTLIYAIIGLIIVAVAQLIVHFVLNQTNSLTTNSGA